LPALILVFPAAVTAQVPPVPGTGPALEGHPKLFAAKRTIDLGEMMQGDKASITWVLENQGNADLIINRVRSSCGCTVVKIKEEDYTIPPGGSLNLKAEFDSKGRRGEQSKSVTVFTNDPAEPELKLSFTARIKQLYDMKPGSGVLFLGTVQRGTQARKTVDVISVRGMPKAEIVDLQVDSGSPISLRHEAFVDERRSAEGQRVFIDVSPEAAVGSLRETIQMKMKVGDIERTETITVRGNVTGELSVRPLVVDAIDRDLRRGQGLEPVRIHSLSKLPFSILEIDAGDRFDVAVEPGLDGPPSDSYEIKLSVAPDAPGGPFATVLAIRTDSLDQPCVEVPVYGNILPLIKVMPPLLLFREDGTPKGVRRSVKLQASPQQRLDVLNVSCALPEISADIDMERSKWYEHLLYLDVRYEGGLAKGTHQTVLNVTTNVPGAETVEVPVTIVVP
jgi:hypothetical protein